MWIAASLFLILIHQSLPLEHFLGRSQDPLKNFPKAGRFSVQPGSKTIKFIHLLKNCGETSQGSPNSVLKWHPRDVPRTLFENVLKNTLLLYYFPSYFTECIAWNTGKLAVTYCYSFEEPSCGSPQNVPKRRPYSNVLGTSVLNFSLFSILFY